jgi:hypothetical protein
VASRNDVTTQLKLMAFSPSDFSMAGNAMFIDDIRNVPINDVMATMASMETCFFVQCIKKNDLLQLIYNFYLW